MALDYDHLDNVLLHAAQGASSSAVTHTTPYIDTDDGIRFFAPGMRRGYLAAEMWVRCPRNKLPRLKNGERLNVQAPIQALDGDKSEWLVHLLLTGDTDWEYLNTISEGKYRRELQALHDIQRAESLLAPHVELEAHHDQHRFIAEYRAAHRALDTAMAQGGDVEAAASAFYEIQDRFRGDYLRSQGVQNLEPEDTMEKHLGYTRPHFAHHHTIAGTHVDMLGNDGSRAEGPRRISPRGRDPFSLS